MESEQPRDAMEAVRAGMGKVTVPNKMTPVEMSTLDFINQHRADKATIAAHVAEIVRQGEALAAVTTERDSMREALEFYADEQNYWSASSLRKNPMGRIETDNGAKARAARAKKGEAKQ